MEKFLQLFFLQQGSYPPVQLWKEYQIAHDVCVNEHAFVYDAVRVNRFVHVNDFDHMNGYDLVSSYVRLNGLYVYGPAYVSESVNADIPYHGRDFPALILH
ncbi:hypothetical protein C823_008014 [Eubacterium plexicaudatum ASF492]|nr:hypothetical protein C823_008014 [Eubacterium plexicaudatum ASF492]